MKRSVILTDCLGPDISSAFWTKGQVLHRERAHLKVPGSSIVLNVLLTRKVCGNFLTPSSLYKSDHQTTTAPPLSADLITSRKRSSC